MCFCSWLRQFLCYCTSMSCCLTHISKQIQYFATEKKSYIFVAPISPIFRVTAFNTFPDEAIPTCSTYTDAQGPLAPCWLQWSSASSLGTDMWACECVMSEGCPPSCGCSVSSYCCHIPHSASGTMRYEHTTSSQEAARAHSRASIQ